MTSAKTAEIDCRLHTRSQFILGLCCGYCRRPLSRQVITSDHIQPKHQGGSSSPDNLVLCCRNCNQHKADLSLKEWSEVLKTLLETVTDMLSRRR